MCNMDAEMIRQATLSHLVLRGFPQPTERIDAITIVANSLELVYKRLHARSSYLAWSAAGYESALRTLIEKETR